MDGAEFFHILRQFGEVKVQKLRGGWDYGKEQEHFLSGNKEKCNVR